MSIALLIIALLIVGVFVWLASQPATFHVERSKEIQATPELLFDTVANLKSWPQWSPWLIHEPATRLEYSEQTSQEGSWYNWDGELVGAGKITHLKLEQNKEVQQRIEFQRPMKSTSEVQFNFEPLEDGKTRITWAMNGKMPFLFRWMSSKMDQWVGTDYEIGLIRLAHLLSDKEEPFELEFSGAIESEKTHYIFAHYEGAVGPMPELMQKTFPELFKAVQEAGLTITGAPFSLYHKFDPVKDFVSCDMCIPIQQAQQLSGYASGELQSRKYFRTEMRGSYDFFSQAWYAAFSHLRMSKQKFDKSAAMIERYVTDPTDKSGLALISHIDLPIK